MIRGVIILVKRKFANRPDWKRVLQRKFKTTYIKNDNFDGHVSMTLLEKVNPPLIKNMLEKDYCLADDGYIWLEILPTHGNYAITTMYNISMEIIQWYFDIIKDRGVTKDGIPYFDDLFLDVVVLPTSEILLLDEDELKDALDKGEITNQEYDMAYAEANRIIGNIASDIRTLSDFTNRYLNELLSL